jgi:hypothetical protein
MDLRASIDVPRRERLVRATTHAYLAWRRRCDATSDAYRRWADAEEGDAQWEAWRAYELALAGEKEASVSYVQLVERVADFEARGNELLIASGGRR